MLTFKPPTCLLRLSLILANLATLPRTLVYTVYTFKAQDLVFYILIYRHVAGYVEHLVLQHKTPKSFQVPKQQNLFHNRQSFAGISGKVCGDRTPTLSEPPRSNFSEPFFPPGQHTFHWQKCFRSAFHTYESSVQPVAGSSGCLQTAWVIFHREFTHWFLKHRLKWTAIYLHLMNR